MNEENNIFEYYADGIEKINQRYIEQLREITKRYVYIALFTGFSMGTTIGLIIGVLV